MINSQQTSSNTQQYKSKRQQKIAEKLSKNKQSSNTSTKTCFRDAERNFKSRLPPPDFSFIFIPNPFTPAIQKFIIKKCLKDYAKSPNISNLDTHYLLPKDGLWNLHEKYFNKDHDDEKDGENEPSQLIRKLRWITLGYQYHWPSKTYHFDRKFPFPKDLENLTKLVVLAINGLSDTHNNLLFDYSPEEWKPEAGVVNFYQSKDSLMAHIDKSEENMSAPLISFSFGHSCIFLIGGSTRDIPPEALYLRSGDISIMYGPSRANFHGVPRILENTLPSYLEQSNNNDPDWNIYAEYMSTSRINVNVRQ
ncbi:7898_t:CDS:2, partial [Entrophospora sp. SA101]